MQAELTVAIGPEEAALEFPWSSPDPEVRYFDLRRRPEHLLDVPEAYSPRELGEFLNSVNGPTSLLESVKCDRWFTREMQVDDEVFGASCKACSYVDLVFYEVPRRFSFENHETFGQRLAELMHRAPEISAGLEIVVRRCHYLREPYATRVANGDVAGKDFESDPGFSLTLFLSGYGDDEADAWQRWGIATKLLQHALLQMAAAERGALPGAGS
jgi:hypothetical protein